MSTFVQCLKRKHTDVDISWEPISKKAKLSHHLIDTSNVDLCTPSGTQWRNNSCAYNAVVTILLNVWMDQPMGRSQTYRDMNNELLGPLADGFARHNNGTTGLNDVHDILKRKLQRLNSLVFAWGMEVSVHTVVEKVLQTHHSIISSSL